jgi:hypothetical protein
MVTRMKLRKRGWTAFDGRKWLAADMEATTNGRKWRVDLSRRASCRRAPLVENGPLNSRPFIPLLIATPPTNDEDHEYSEYPRCGFCCQSPAKLPCVLKIALTSHSGLGGVDL